MATLAELTRVAQVALEQHRCDPTDQQTLTDLVHAQAERDTAWLEHTIQKVR